MRTGRRRIAAASHQDTAKVVQSEARTNTCFPGSSVKQTFSGGL